MTDLGDLIGRVQLGDQPVSVPFPLYAELAAELNTARDEIERLGAALAVRTRRLVTARADLHQATTERDNACAELVRVQGLLARAEGGTR